MKYNEKTKELIAEVGMKLKKGDVIVSKVYPCSDPLEWVEVGESQNEIVEAIQAKIAEIEAYYNSDEINLVSIQGIDIYLDPDTRFKLAERLNAAKASKIENVNITLNGNTFNLTVVQAEAMLNAIVLQYASAYDIKESKIKEVDLLTDIKAIQAYDAKSGYPTKLVL